MATSGSSVSAVREVYISELKEGRVDGVLVCRVCRAWKVPNPKKGGELMSLDFVILDRKNDVIFCTTPRSRYITEFDAMVKEGYVYEVTNFVVAPWKPGYRVLHDREVCLFFDSSTNMVRLGSDVPAILRNKFNLISYDRLLAVSQNRGYLCDVIGVVTSLSDVVERTYNDQVSKMQVVELADARGHVLKVTVWGDDRTRDVMMMSKSGSRVWVATSTIVKTDRKGNVYVSSSSATKLYDSLELAEIGEFVESCADGIGGELRRTRLYSQYVIRSDYDKWRRTVAEVQDMLAAKDAFTNLLYVYGTIVSIGDQNGWKYNACNGCKKKITFENGKYFCDVCARYEHAPAVRYRVEFVLDDGTAAIDCVMFEREVDKIANISASDLADLMIQEECNDPIPRQLRRMIGKSFIFQLRFNEFNRGGKMENFTVNRIVNEADIKDEEIVVNAVSASVPADSAVDTAVTRVLGAVESGRTGGGLALDVVPEAAPLASVETALQLELPAVGETRRLDDRRDCDLGNEKGSEAGSTVVHGRRSKRQKTSADVQSMSHVVAS